MDKPCPKPVEEIIATLREAQTVCIVGHVRPDGDCIGSQLGLAHALANAGKTVTVWNEDPVPDKLRFLDARRLVKQPEAGCRFDVVVAMPRLGFRHVKAVFDTDGRAW